MENKKNIYEKLFLVKKAGIKLQRDTQGYGYKYATLNQIQEKLGEVMDKLGLLVTHRVFKNEVITSIVNVEAPEEQVESSIIMNENTKAQDKGSEITYYRRYNLLSLLDLETEDDDGKKAQDSGKNEVKNEDDKPWMDEVAFLKLKENIGSFSDADDAIKKARMKYKVSRAYADRITDLF